MQKIKKRAVVAVISQNQQFLAIRRSRWVKAPGKICFPGGTIEPAESEQQALIREIREEIGLDAKVGSRLYSNVTDWGTSVVWWTAEIESGAIPKIEPREVEEWYWMHPDSMLAHPDLLSSNQDFLLAGQLGQYTIPGIRIARDRDDSDR